MQNYISGNTSTINLDEIIGTNLGNNVQNSTDKGRDFAKVLGNFTNDGKNFAKDKIQKFANNELHTKNYKDNIVNVRRENNNTVKETPDTKTSGALQNEKISANEQNKDKTVDTVDTKPVSKEIKETSQGNNTQVLSSDEVIQNSVTQLNNLIENSLNGQLDINDVKDIKAALEEIQTKIENNEIVVSEDTKQMLSGIMERLLTQNPEDLEISSLEKDLRQLSKDIQANSFKLQSQVKAEEEADNPTKALELNIEEPEIQTVENKTAQNDQNNSLKTKTEKTAEATVNVSSEIKENKSVNKSQNSNEIEIKQDMLDEMDVKIEKVFDSSANTDTNSNNTNYSTAADEVIKLNIEKADADNITPVTFAFDKSPQSPASTKPIQLEGVSKELNTSDILNQIGSKFDGLKDGANTKITMTLRPNDLGRVTIELMQTANGVSTNIIAQNSQVKELLDKNIDILKQQLAQQGVNVQNVQVKTVEQNAQTGLNNSFNDRQNGEQEAKGRGQEQGGNKEQSGQRQRSYNFEHSNIQENADFSNNDTQNTTQINTMGGKIRYNV